ncbi:MAG TPA: glycosyltransferase 61 family protein [Trichocoleus sp.]|jgi:tetratricopeptide (TPR) repeat protein
MEIDTAETLQREKNELAEMYCELGQGWLLQDNQVKAEYCFQQAKKLIPDFYWKQRNLGIELAEQGQWGAARRQYQKAALLNGWYSFVSHGYCFTYDWLTYNIPYWKTHLQSLAEHPINALEIGSWEGASTCWFLDNILTHESSRITCIDTFEGSVEHQFFDTDYIHSIEARFDDNIARTQAVHKLDKRVGLSEEILPQLPANSYDLIYIDGSHEMLDVLFDALWCWQLAKVGGIIVFDDYEWGDQREITKVPKPAIDAFLLEFGDKVEVLHQGYQVLVKKKSHSEFERNLVIFRMANQLQELGKIDAAIECYQLGIRFSPDFCWFYSNMSELFARQGKVEKTVETAHIAVSLNSSHPFTYQKNWITLSKQGKLKETIVYCQTLINTQTDTTSIYYALLAEIWASQGQFSKATSCYQASISVDSELVMSHNGLAEVLKATNQPDEAIKCYRDILKLNPNHPWIYYFLGCLLKETNAKETVDLLRQAIKKCSEKTTPWVFYTTLGYALMKEQELDEAVNAYEMAIQIEPSYFGHRGLGLVFLEREEPWRAIDHFLQALTFDNAREIYYDLANALEKLNLLDEAAYCCRPFVTDLSINAIEKCLNLKANWSVVNEISTLESVNCIHLEPSTEVILSHPKTVDAYSKDVVIRTEGHWHQFDSHKLRTTGTFAAVIRNGRAYCDDRTHFVISEENFIIEALSYRGFNLAMASIQGKLEPHIVPGRIAYLSSSEPYPTYNYSHWLVDVFPRFDLLRQANIDITQIDYFVLKGANLPFHQQTLNLLGIPEAKILDANRHPYIQADELIVPSIYAHPGNFCADWVIQFLRKNILSQEINIDSSKYPKYFYITRLGAPNARRVVNEADVMDLLSQYGFEFVTLDTLPVVEQARLFANAEMIVAPHGAGLTNLIFCQPGTKVVEIFSPFYGMRSYWVISNQCKLNYQYLISRDFKGLLEKALNSPPDLLRTEMNQEDILVDLESLKRALEFN